MVQSVTVCFSVCSCADLTKHMVSDYAAISELMELGNSHRYTVLSSECSSEIRFGVIM